VWRILTRRKKSDSERSSISRGGLESAITEAVKQADPAFETFAGVLVQRETPKADSGVNWSIRSVRFGKVDREKSGQALATVVERMQRKFSLADDPAAKAKRRRAS
jgi:hypothetical protein